MRSKGRDKRGRQLYAPTCWNCYAKGYRLYKKDYCEECFLEPELSAILEVDHVDGNHANNDLSNLRTLCANCHRMKTFYFKDWLPSKNFKKPADSLQLTLFEEVESA